MGAGAAKTAKELALLKESLRILIASFRSLQKDIRPGITEAELASLMGRYIRGFGAQSTAFKTIAACGRSSAVPHAVPSRIKVIRRNQHVVIDAGARYKGYNSDLTRTFFTGRISPAIRRVYNTVKEAQRRAIGKVRPGIKASYIDNIARAYIKKKGFGKYFIHGLGHGVGRKVHEAPKISASSKDILKRGMVITIEPGIYIPRIGGVRIEDMILVTKKGCKVLSRVLPR